MECYRKIKWFYRTFLYNYLYFDCILVTRHPNGGHRSDRNMLIKKNNMWLKCAVVYHISIKQHKCLMFSIIKHLLINEVQKLHDCKCLFHSFIPLACAECGDSLPFSGASSIPLCYVHFLPPFSTIYCSILPHLILPSVSWSTFQSCCSQVHIKYSFGNSIFFHSLYMPKPT